MSEENTNLEPGALKPKDAAKFLSISERKLWTLTAGRQIPHIRLGKLVLYRPEALRTWLEQQEIPVLGPAL